MIFKVATIAEVFIDVRLSTCLHHLTNVFISENELECFQNWNIYEFIINRNLFLSSSFVISSGVIPNTKTQFNRVYYSPFVSEILFPFGIRVQLAERVVQTFK